MAAQVFNTLDIDRVKERRTLDKYVKYIEYQIELYGTGAVQHWEDTHIVDKYNDEEITILDALKLLYAELTTQGLSYIGELKKKPYQLTLKKLNLVFYKISKDKNGITLLWYLFNNLFGYSFNGWWVLANDNIATFNQANRSVMHHEFEFDEFDRVASYLRYIMLFTTTYTDIYHKEKSLLEIISAYVIDYRKDLVPTKLNKYSRNRRIETFSTYDQVATLFKDLIHRDIIFRVEKENKLYYVLGYIFEQERDTEQHLNNLKKMGKYIEETYEVDTTKKHLPDKDQIEAIKMCIRNPFMILSGGPGRGKTFLVAIAIKYLQTHLTKCKIICVAVAGTAANQLNLSLREKLDTMDNIEIGTFAKKIQFNKTLIEKDIENYVFVVDEASMLDQNQCHYISKKINQIGYNKCKLIFMGDPEQLPSIGLGNIMHDLITSNLFPHKELKQIHRTESEQLIKLLDNIKTNKFGLEKAASLKRALNHSKNTTIYIHHDQKIGDDFCRNGKEKFAKKIITKIKNSGINPKNTIFLSPENGPKWANESIPANYKTKSWFCSVHYLNILIRDIFNHLGKIAEDGTITRNIPKSSIGLKHQETDFGYLQYRVGDRIQFNTNDYSATNEPDIYRGMLGTIVDFNVKNKKTYIKIKFDDIPKYTKEISLNELNSDDVRLGYAMTIHKAQGITKDNVFMFIMNNHYYSLSNNGKALGYVGASRSKHKLFLFTNGNTLNCFKVEKLRRTGLFKCYTRTTK
jgi:hypothetical protein